MKKFFIWLEEDNARTRKLVLLSTVFVFLFITLIVFGVSFFGIIITSTIVTIYGTLSALMVSIYGFYTGTSSDKTGKVADKAADILMKKLDSSNQSN